MRRGNCPTQAKAIASRTCTFDGAPASCGDQSADEKKATTYTVTLTGFGAGSHTFVVNATTLRRQFGQRVRLVHRVEIARAQPEGPVFGPALLLSGIPQHPNEHRPQRPVLLTVDQQLGRTLGIRVPKTRSFTLPGSAMRRPPRAGSCS